MFLILRETEKFEGFLSKGCQKCEICIIDFIFNCRYNIFKYFKF
jgi:hypothetical protein